MLKKIKKNLFNHYKPPINKLVKKLVHPRKLREYAINVARLRREWDEERERASRQGTEFHNQEEKLDYERGWAINPFDGSKYEVIDFPKARRWDNTSYPGGLMAMPDGYYPEALLYDLECLDPI